MGSKQTPTSRNANEEVVRERHCERRTYIDTDTDTGTAIQQARRENPSAMKKTHTNTCNDKSYKPQQHNLFQVRAVHVRRPRLVLLLRLLHVGDTVGAEELSGVEVSPALHDLQLRRLPLVQLDAPHERHVDPHRTVNGGAVVADEYAVRRRGPRRVAGPTVEADLLGQPGVTGQQSTVKYKNIFDLEVGVGGE